MNYANTVTTPFGKETVVTVLPLSSVPSWDPNSPLEGTYAVPDDVQQGWVRNPITGSFEAPVASSTVPQKVSRFQAFAALYQAGLLDDVEAYMGLPATDFLVRLAWKEAQEFERGSPMIQSIGPQVGLTESQVDDLFTFASTISA